MENAGGDPSQVAQPYEGQEPLENLHAEGSHAEQGHAGGDPGVIQRLREFHPRFLNAADLEIFATSLKLSDALLAIAREHGFPSWARLKSHIAKPTRANQLDLPHHERIEDPTFRHAVDLLDGGDVAGLRAYLKQHPKLARQHVIFEGGNYFRNPTLLEFVAENPVRHNALPANILEETLDDVKDDRKKAGERAPRPSATKPSSISTAVSPASPA